MKLSTGKIKWRITGALILALIIQINHSTVTAQLPSEAVLPEGKSAWAIDQNFRTSIVVGTYAPGYIRVIILSNGKVFHRKSFDNGQPATPWCQDNFTAIEMREISSAVAKSKPGSWLPKYGDWLNMYAPYRKLILTRPDANGKPIQYITFVYREYSMAAEIAALVKATDEAGNLAFANCAQPLPDNNAPITDKIENGAPIYTVNGKGDLLWYNHLGFRTGDNAWANNGSAKTVGQGWANNLKIFQADPGGKGKIIYTVSPEGWLTWYKHHGYASGSTDWEAPKNVGTGFTGQHVFSGGNGVIYMVDQAGDLYWYKHSGYQTGEKIWVNNGTGKKVGNGWGNNRFVFSGNDGVIYRIDNRGDLYWYKHLGFQDGTARWQEAAKIGGGWIGFSQVFSGGGGIIYALNTDGTLGWYQHLGFPNGANSWANNGLIKITNNNWNFKFAF